MSIRILPSVPLLVAVLALSMALSMALPVRAQTPSAAESELARAVERGLTQECIGDVRGAESTWSQVAASAEQLLATKPTNTFYLLASARAAFGLDDFPAASKGYGRFGSVLAMYKTDVAADYPWTLVYQGLVQARLGNAQAMVQAWELVPSSLDKVYYAVLQELRSLPEHPSQQDMAGAAGRVESALFKAQAQALGGDKDVLMAVGGVGMGMGADPETVPGKVPGKATNVPGISIDPSGGGNVQYGVSF